jgi:3-phenylpropionate/cinnamic acid dioxygenase small subunit
MAAGGVGSGENMGDDEDQIRRTLHQYSQWCDDGRFDEWAGLFTEDARLVLAGQITRGRLAIEAYMRTVQADGRRGLHVTTNALVEVAEGSTTATATSDYLFVRPSADGLAIIAAGRYLDRLVRDADGWRFSEREITMLTASAGSADA